MRAYTQIDSTGRAETPSLDPQVFDHDKGPVIECAAKAADNYTDGSPLDFMSGERARVEGE